MYQASADRYDQMPFARCGRSGLDLPKIALGLWQNFGSRAALEPAREMLLRSFDRGITHFDLANNYGPEYGTAEENFGRDHGRPTSTVSRRTDPLHQGRIRHVARSLRAGRREPQVHARKPRPEPRSYGRRLRRHLLLAPFRPHNAARGDDGGPGHRGPAAARRCMSESPHTVPPPRRRRRPSFETRGHPA